MVQGGGTAVFDLGALQYNLKLMRQAVNGTQEIMACVKANAYGHGSETVARCLEDQGVQWLAVGTVAEAIALRRPASLRESCYFQSWASGQTSFFMMLESQFPFNLTQKRRGSPVTSERLRRSS